MKKIQVLGTGCPKCKQLVANAEQAANELGIEYEMIKVTDITEIIKLGIMMTPGLLIDGEVKVSGKVVSSDDIKQWLI